MPIVWIVLSGLGGLVSGIIYEKETDEKVAQTTAATPSFSWWDKTLMVAAGIAALYIFKKVR